MLTANSSVTHEEHNYNQHSMDLFIGNLNKLKVIQQTVIHFFLWERTEEETCNIFAERKNWLSSPQATGSNNLFNEMLRQLLGWNDDLNVNLLSHAWYPYFQQKRHSYVLLDSVSSRKFVWQLTSESGNPLTNLQIYYLVHKLKIRVLQLC